MGTKEHKKDVLKQLDIAIISVSTTRALVDDKSGIWIKNRAKKEGHKVVFHQVVADDVFAISETVRSVIQDQKPHAVLLTGGTGISNKDVTIEAVRTMFLKEMTSFGPIFAQLSFEEIDSAAILSRATAGIIGETVLFCMPGSLKACKLACKVLIFPELGHVVKHIHEG